LFFGDEREYSTAILFDTQGKHEQEMSKNSQNALVIVESPPRRTPSKIPGQGIQGGRIGRSRDGSAHQQARRRSRQRLFAGIRRVARQEEDSRSDQKDAKSADEVFLALDLDREGEAIAWHIRDYIAPVQKNVKRSSSTRITKSAIQGAIDQPTRR
jgi:reverse gyrase